MSGHEYKVVPAPKKGLRSKGVRGTEQKFANALQEVINQHAALGWDYLRTDTLPCEERQGLTGKSTTFQNMLIFRRARDIAPTEKNTAPSIETTSAPVIAPPLAAASVEERPAALDLLKYGNSEAEKSPLKQSDEPRLTLGGVTKEASD